MNVLRIIKPGHRSTVIELMLSLAFPLLSDSKFPSESIAVMRSSDEKFVFCYQLKLKCIR